MRMVKTLLVGAVFYAGAAAMPAFAVPLAVAPDVPGNPGIVDVAVHCGPHAHYVHAHRDRNGHHVLGRCVRYRHHH
jgi:hypothetical protein